MFKGRDRAGPKAEDEREVTSNVGDVYNLVTCTAKFSIAIRKKCNIKKCKNHYGNNSPKVLYFKTS